MATPTKSIKLELGGKDRDLRFDFNALAAFEKETGQNALSAAAWTSHSATSLRALLWAASLHVQPDLTLEEVGSWLHLMDADAIADALNAAIQAAMPEPKDDSGAEQGKN